MSTSLDSHPIVDRATWLESRLELLEAEKAFTRQREALAARRRGLPWVRIDRDYRFWTERGEATLADLFAGRSQLVVYHFMYAPDWDQGCPSCSFWADCYAGTEVHLAQRDITLMAVSRAPLEALLAYRERMGWSFPWASSVGSSFNYDFGVSFREGDRADGKVEYNYARRAFPGDEAPGLSCFYLSPDGTVFHTYSCYARGLDPLSTAYQVMDLVPKGRDEDDLPFPMAWVRRHDEY